MAKDPQSLKWQITINNPLEKGFSHERIKEEISQLKSIVYWCMADEVGTEEKTPHTHVYVAFSSNVRFSTLKKRFETAHLERAYGSSQDNRDYVAKAGKWENDEKCDSKLEGTFEEWGEMPIERQGGWNIETEILRRIVDGASNAEILLEFPDYLRGLRDVDYVRQTLRAEEYREKWRSLEVTYISGPTGTGKTRYVMDGCGYSNVYAVNNYKHPFDGYAGESVMLFDEFTGNIRIQDMNNYLDGYPIALPARYSNKQACFERVFIVSNLDIREQYRNEQLHQCEFWDAFIRRIHRVILFLPDGSRSEYQTRDYLSGVHDWVELPDGFPLPF